MIKFNSMGAPSVTDCVAGLNLTIKNARRLYKEGLKLEKTKSPTAIFLYAIAIEELGKAHLLGTIIIGLLENKTIKWKDFWRVFKSHKIKQTGILSMTRLGQVLLLENFEEIKNRNPNYLKYTPNINTIKKNIKDIDKIIEEVESGQLEVIKWKHIYVDFQNGGWLFPHIDSPNIFRKENVATYLTDINTMRKHLLKELKKIKTG